MKTEFFIAFMTSVLVLGIVEIYSLSRPYDPIRDCISSKLRINSAVCQELAKNYQKELSESPLISE